MTEQQTTMSGNTGVQGISQTATATTPCITVPHPMAECGECEVTTPTTSFKNYCPQCQAEGKLVFHEADDDFAKSRGKYGNEITCDQKNGGCGADYCSNCGKEKIKGTKYYLEKCEQQTQNISKTSTSANVKDKTFEDCIKRICSATDSVFLVINNTAILFPYTDWMSLTLRQKNTTIPAVDMDPDIFEFDYNNEGFYNKVTIKYSGGEVSKQYDDLVKKYGVLEKVVDSEVSNQNTAEYLANALLIQYIRDFNNSCKVRVLNQQNYYGGTFYNVENPITNVTQPYYLQGYTMRTQQNEPLYFDLDFRYGPEGAEELGDYQAFSSGGVGGGQQLQGNGNEQQIWADAAKIHYGDSPYQDPQEAYNALQPHLGEASCITDCYGMSAYLYYRFNNEAGIPACILQGSGSGSSGTHRVVALYKNNQWYRPREEYRQLENLFHYNDSCMQTNNVLLESPYQSFNGSSVPQSGNTGG